MDSFGKKFVEEALDLLNELEKVLLSMAPDSEDKEQIEHIFRIMHTLKGNSGMFGFNLIGQYTHNLETIYDLIRTGKMKVTPVLMDLTLESVDHIRNLLDEENSSTIEVQTNHKNLLDKIDQIIDSKPEPAKGKKTETAPEMIVIHTYYVNFQPNPGMLYNGSNPLFVVEDFSALGDYLVFPNFKNLPSLENLDPEKCYTGWELLISTRESIDKISEIFIFVDDNCSLDIQEISEKDLVHDPEFCKKIKESASEENSLGINIIKEIVNQAEKPEIKDQKSEIREELAEKKEGLIEKKEELTEPKEKSEIINKFKNISSIRVASEKLDELINLVSELVTTQAGLSLIAEKIKNKDLLAITEDVEKLSRRLRDSTFSIRLIPIEDMITRFQRLVRELSHELKKDIAFITEGTDIELDKTMIEGLIDPIMHILRNSIDHGIEAEDTRQKLGKPKQGKILLKAYHSGSNVFIKISDDGAGIDVNVIRQSALKKGLIQPETDIGGKEILDLIFLPGFTTTENITKISGRGVGMDVVKRKISDLRGEVNIETKINSGTAITIKLPLTLSIIDGLLVEIDKAFFVIPLSSVNKCIEFKHETLMNAVNNLIFVNDGHIPLIYLRKEFEITSPAPTIEQVIVVEYGEIRIGLAVDKVIGEYQAVLKSLGSAFKKQEIITGATILGDGTVALVVDPDKIISQFNYQNLTKSA